MWTWANYLIFQLLLPTCKRGRVALTHSIRCARSCCRNSPPHIAEAANSMVYVLVTFFGHWRLLGVFSTLVLFSETQEDRAVTTWNLAVTVTEEKSMWGVVHWLLQFLSEPCKWKKYGVCQRPLAHITDMIVDTSSDVSVASSWAGRWMIAGRANTEFPEKRVICDSLMIY